MSVDQKYQEAVNTLKTQAEKNAYVVENFNDIHKFYSPYVKKILRYKASKYIDPDKLETAWQDVFTQLFQHCEKDKFRHECSIKTYLSRLCDYKILGVTQPKEDETNLGDEEVEDSTELDKFEGFEVEKQDTFLECLMECIRKNIIDRFTSRIEGSTASYWFIKLLRQAKFSYKDIAEILKSTPGAIRTRIFKQIQKIKKCKKLKKCMEKLTNFTKARSVYTEEQLLEVLECRKLLSSEKNLELFLLECNKRFKLLEDIEKLKQKCIEQCRDKIDRSQPSLCV